MWQTTPKKEGEEPQVIELPKKAEISKKEVKQLNQIFTPLSEVAARRKLKIGLYGETETGKSHFCLTCPEPIYFIDTEFGVAPLRKKFANKKIYVLECFVENPETLKVDPIRSLDMMDEAIDSLKDVNEGTIAIDSGTDIWDWLEEYMKSRVSAQMRELQQFDWGIANKRYKEMMMRLLSRDTVFVITAQPKELYIGAQRSGIYAPSWQKKTPFWVDVILHLQKFPPATHLQKTRYMATITKCRAERMYDKQIEDISYDKLYEAVKQYL